MSIIESENVDASLSKSEDLLYSKHVYNICGNSMIIDISD